MMRYAGMGTLYVPGGDATVVASGPYIGNPLDLRSGAPCAHQGGARSRAGLGLGSPTVVLAQRRLPGHERISPTPSLSGKIRQPLMLIAAGRDEIVSTAAIEDFAMRLRAGSHLIVAGAATN